MYAKLAFVAAVASAIHLDSDSASDAEWCDANICITYGEDNSGGYGSGCGSCGSCSSCGSCDPCNSSISCDSTVAAILAEEANVQADIDALDVDTQLGTLSSDLTTAAEAALDAADNTVANIRDFLAANVDDDFADAATVTYTANTVVIPSACVCNSAVIAAKADLEDKIAEALLETKINAWINDAGFSGLCADDFSGSIFCDQ